MYSQIHIDGAWVPEAEARISVYDRGFLMADAVYEVTTVLEGRLVDFDGHHARLCRSLSELEIANPHDREAWLALHREAVQRNDLTEGTVYVQVSRGNPGARGFDYPGPNIPPTVVMISQSRPGMADTPALRDGIRVALLPDMRWKRRDIKTVQLLWPSRAKMLARAEGAEDAWLFENGLVTEGTSNNAWIIRGGHIVTRALSSDILGGITRAAILEIASASRLEISERSFTPQEARDADEAFVTSATAFVTPVIAIDGRILGDGHPGPITRRLQKAYFEAARRDAL